MLCGDFSPINKILPIVRYDSARHSAGRSVFDCGNEDFNNFLKTRASQQERRNLLTLWISFDENRGAIAAYYTLSAASINYEEGSAATLAAGFKVYSTLPAILLGRLAVDNKYQGDGGGAALVRDALIRSVLIAKGNVGAYAMVVDPYEGWLVTKLYAPLGFQPLYSDQPLGRQVILLGTVAKALG